MLRAFKEKVKRRIRYHLNRQLSEATKDIEFARQFRAGPVRAVSSSKPRSFMPPTKNPEIILGLSSPT
jgi:hypothetical protein